MNIRLIISLLLLLDGSLDSFSIPIPDAAVPAEADRQAGPAKATKLDVGCVGNRAPLAPSPFLKLPIGSITPKGWLRQMLELERDGMTGRLKEISPWLDFERSSWADEEGKGHFGWEEMPYWLKGYGDLGYVLKDDAIIAEARKWIEAAMASQGADGFFGPRELLTALGGKPDLWPHMVMLNVLQSYHDFSGDKRVLDVMTKYFRWQNQLPAAVFGGGYWPKLRMGDNIESVYWLYNRTGDAWLLDLAAKMHRNMARWDQDVIDWHNVNVAQGFREPAIYWMQAQDPALLAGAERNYSRVMTLYGQFPGGGFAGDENARPGYGDPRQGFETCGIVEFMHSFELLTRVTGQPIWADRCEEIAFNSLPAALTPDQKALHYLTCANQVQLDPKNKAPGIQNKGTMFSYSPFDTYRCCQHNVSHGWPYYAEELWLATPDRGICASLYAPSEVIAKVGNGSQVRISEETEYPFGDTVELKIATSKPARFPLYLRIPRWCESASIRINGKVADATNSPLSYAVLDRTWKNGDRVTLRLPMKVQVRRWALNQDAASVSYGPLWFSLKIEEKWERYGNRNPNWPEWQVLPASAWNYGLVLEEKDPAASFRLIRFSESVKDAVHRGFGRAQPFAPDTTPVRIEAKARKIPNWQQDHNGLVTALQASPAKTSEPVETVTLIPMGAARLRISSFPVAGEVGSGHEWVARPEPSGAAPYKPSASHCWPSDSVTALCDGLEPANSNDPSVPRFTWWDHAGTPEWVQFEFEAPRKISSASVYWFDDTGAGQCRVPKSWQLLYLEGDVWVPVTASEPFGLQKDDWNSVAFEPVQTKALRLVVQLQPEFSGGILEWKVK